MLTYANIYQLGAVQFIENLDRTSLTISDEEFEKNVEAAVSAIAEKHEAEVAGTPPSAQLSDKSALGRPEVTPRHSMEGESSVPRKLAPSNEYDNSEEMDDKAAMTGLLRTIQRPLTSIGQILGGSYQQFISRWSSENSITRKYPSHDALSSHECRAASKPTAATKCSRSRECTK